MATVEASEHFQKSKRAAKSFDWTISFNAPIQPRRLNQPTYTVVTNRRPPHRIQQRRSLPPRSASAHFSNPPRFARHKKEATALGVHTTLITVAAAIGIGSANTARIGAGAPTVATM